MQNTVRWWLAKACDTDGMRYQWHARKVNRVDFNQFGKCCNEDGFELAPWHDLVDLISSGPFLIDEFDVLVTKAPDQPAALSRQRLRRASVSISVSN